MLILLALLCADPTADYEAEVAVAKDHVILAGKKLADILKESDPPATTRILSDLQFFLSNPNRLPTCPHLLPLRDYYVGKRAIARQKLLDATADPERSKLESQWARDDLSSPPPQRRKWESTLGTSFRQRIGNKWAEYTKGNDVAFEFRETGRDHGFVELFDASRKLTVRLHETKAYCTSQPGVWTDLCDGKWVE